MTLLARIQRYYLPSSLTCYLHVRRQHKGPPSLAVLRVAQLDAGRLDVELASMLQEQLRKAFAFFRPVRLLDGTAACMFAAAWRALGSHLVTQRMTLSIAAAGAHQRAGAGTEAAAGLAGE